VFHGKCNELYVVYRGFADISIDWYTPEWNYLNIKERTGVWKSAGYMERPKHLHYMIDLAELLGMPFDFIRVDLYLVNDRIYFGELTNYPTSGMFSFIPVSHDFELGSKWKIIPKYWKQGNYRKN
jgi:hypothetical protein